jgi:hypothetical protein
MGILGSFLVIFRLLIWGFAVLQATFALWLLTPALVRPSISYFPADSATLKELPSRRTRAHRAAIYGYLRGDLWADYMLVLAAGVIADLQGGTPFDAAPNIEEARRAAKRAAQLAPHDARAWLIIAALASRGDPSPRNIAEPLKMSFYTGPSESELMPLRVILSTRSELIENEEIRALAAQDIRALATRRPELKQALVTAHRTASPAGKRFIEATLEKVDAALLRTLDSVAR